MVICMSVAPSENNIISCKLIAFNDAVFDPLLSIVTISGNPLEPIALSKKVLAAASSRSPTRQRTLVYLKDNFLATEPEIVGRRGIISMETIDCGDGRR
jgi:hypothetical protein